MAAVLVISMVALGPTANGQLPQTRLFAVDPPAVRVDTVSDVIVSSGADLEELHRLLFNHPGIFCAPHLPKAGDTAATDPLTFRVAVDASVPPGRYEVRAEGVYGVSNPRMFLVEDRPIVTEQEPDNLSSQSQPLDIAAAMYGVISSPSDVDWFRVAAHKGQRLVIDCQAQQVDSRLDPVLTLYNADERPLRFSDTSLQRDSRIVFEVPHDGEYFLKVHDTTFRGGADFGYRLCVDDRPHIHLVWPPAGLRGSSNSFELFGINLPGGEESTITLDGVVLEKLTIQIDVPLEPDGTGLPSIGADLDVFPYQLVAGELRSNIMAIGLTDTPPLLEQEDAEAAHPQPITIPADIAARFDRPHDVDRYDFEASQGDDLWIEVIGERTGAAIDPYVIVEQITSTADGAEQIQRMTAHDDLDQNLAPSNFDTAADDPVFHLSVTATGRYRITVRDRNSGVREDSSLIYRLLVRRARPDFRLVVLPSGFAAGLSWPVALRRSDHFAVEALVFRRDGFNEPVTVRALSLPYGVSCPATVIPSNESTGTLVFTTAKDAQPGSFPIQVIGTASLPGVPVPGELVQEARAGMVVRDRSGNMPAVARLGSEVWLSVTDETAAFQVLSDIVPAVVHQGRQLLLPMDVTRQDGFDEPITIGAEIPKQAKIDAADVTIGKGQSQQLLRLFIRPDTPPGTYIVTPAARAQVPYRRNPRQVQRRKDVLNERQTLVQSATQRRDQLGQLVQQKDARLQAQREEVSKAESTLAQGRERFMQEEVALKQAQSLLEQAKSAAAMSLSAAKQAQEESEHARQAADGSDDGELATVRDQTRERAEAAERKARETAVALEEARGTHESLLTLQKQKQSQLQSAEMQLQTVLATQHTLEKEAEQVRAHLEAATRQAEQAEAVRKTAEQALQEAEKAAAPQNIKVTQSVPGFRIDVKPAPVAISLQPGSISLKPGESADVKVTLTRQNGFAGPCTISLIAPAAGARITSEAPVLPPDQGELSLKISADGDTPPGDLPYFVIRATADTGEEALIEAPLAIQITNP